MCCGVSEDAGSQGVPCPRPGLHTLASTNFGASRQFLHPPKQQTRTCLGWIQQWCVLVCRRTLRRRHQRRRQHHNCSRMHPTRLRKATARARTRRAARGRRAAASPSTASTTGRIVTELTHRAKGPLVVSRKLTTWFELLRQVSTMQRFGS